MPKVVLTLNETKQARTVRQSDPSAASLLLAEGVGIKVISEVLGHAGITVTLDVFAPNAFRTGEGCRSYGPSLRLGAARATGWTVHLNDRASESSNFDSWAF